ncbi:hypothetical protein JX266_004345 [Neoarthrinium moseri]|nr:hypothetical protein JX266_004345 [Neoarthrinium moseri]
MEAARLAPVLAVRHPSIGRGPKITVEDDARNIQAAMAPHPEKSMEFVAVSHSTAPPRAGACALSVLPPGSDVVDAADWLTVANGKAKAAFHGPEMAEDEADQYLASLLPQSSLTGGPSVGVDEITVPIYYILCEKDQTISPATQQAMISTIPSLKRVLRNPSGHAACVTEVEKLVKPIIEIADEVEKEPKV